MAAAIEPRATICCAKCSMKDCVKPATRSAGNPASEEPAPATAPPLRNQRRAPAEISMSETRTPSIGGVLSLLAFGRQAAAFCSVTCGCTPFVPIAILRGLAASGTRSTWSMPLSSLAPVTWM